MLYVSHIQRRVGLGRNLLYPAPSASVILWHLSNCQWEKCTVCVCSFETIHPSHFSTLQMAAILLTSIHCSPGNLRRACIEDRNKHACLFVCFDKALVSPSSPNLPLSNILEEHWLKLFCHHEERSIKIVHELSRNLKAGARSLLCLPMRSKTAHQTADKTWVKREYFIHSCQRKGGVRY